MICRSQVSNPFYFILSTIAVVVLILMVVYRSVAMERSLSKRTDALQQAVVDNQRTVDSMRTMLLENMRNANIRSEFNSEILKNLQTQISEISSRISRIDKLVDTKMSATQ